MEVVKELGQEQPKQTPAEFNEQLNMEFAVIRVRTAALELMRMKLEMLNLLPESVELTEVKTKLVNSILNFPA